jgi:hypothetical protein
MNLNSMWLGMVSGLLAPAISVFIFYTYQFDTLSFGEFISFLDNVDLTVQVFSLCAMPSFLLFFIFYWAKYNRSAHGAVGATLLITLSLVIYGML